MPRLAAPPTNTSASSGPSPFECNSSPVGGAGGSASAGTASSVPLGSIGVAGILFLTGTSLNIQSLMGSIMMVGIVVSFSVLLVEFANHLRAEAREQGLHKSARDAIVEAAGIRLRPILMTGLSAILGLTPMAIAGGANIPLARAVVGGTLAAVVMVLFVVPPLYLLFKRAPEPAPAD